MHIQSDDQRSSKPAPPETWALEVTSPPLHLLEVVEIARAEGEPPALHLAQRLPLAGPDAWRGVMDHWGWSRTGTATRRANVHTHAGLATRAHPAAATGPAD